jgi:FkbM family methyltransferase
MIRGKGVANDDYGVSQLINYCQAIAMRLLRAMPKVKGHGRVAAVTNRCLLRLGASSLVTVKMKQGHRLLLDTRVQSQVRAAFGGGYDDGEISVLCGLMSGGGVALDVGANIGFYSVPLGCAARVKGGRVMAFEPLPANFQRLFENIALNALEGTVELRMIGLSAARGRAELTLREDFEGGGEVGNASLVIEDGLDVRFHRTSIDLAPLDELWPKLSLARLDIVKADIEGHEDEFLRGARMTLDRYRPVLLMEVNRWFYRRRGVDFDRIIPTLLPSKYDFYRFEPSPPRSHSQIRTPRLARVNGTSDYRDLENAFLIPAERAEEVCRIATEQGVR